MKVPDGFEPVCDSFTENGQKEKLVWVDENSKIIYYPSFFKEELKNPSTEIKHIITDRRQSK